MTTHFQRTTAVFREQGLRKFIDYQKVEFVIPKINKKYDLFNIIDLLVIRPCVLGVQICGADYQSHVRKIRDEKKENTIAWLKSGAQLQIWSWRHKLKKRGGKAKKWVPHIADVLFVKGEIFIEERWK